MGLRFIKAYYYLAPLWCVLEVLAWPGLRAGPMAGGSLPLIGLFYTVEGAVAAAFWTGFWAAEHVALAENLVYLASAAALPVRALVPGASYAPGTAGSGMASAAALARSIPGVAVAVAITAVSLYRLVYLRRHRRSRPRS